MASDTGPVAVFLMWAFGTGQSGRRMSIYFVILVSGVNRSYVLIPIAYSLVIGESLGLVPAVGIVVIMLGLVLFCLPGMRGGGGVGSPQTIFFALGAAGPSASQLWCSTSGHGRTAAEHSPSRSVLRFW